ncbi:hypothetical protein ACEN2J_18610 [Pseudorhodobacter sp. W20_MBD10_FR17]|uniref:hypothetical protein n=1 Tax=Pseudorhodobacter sp. W20_MBD10_FR17 TaxID=3240266 RepID=UPI003F9C4B7F
MRWTENDYFMGCGMGLGPLGLLVMALLFVLPFWKISTKAGFSGWWSLLMFIPVANLVFLYVLAFSDWPTVSGRANRS